MPTAMRLSVAEKGTNEAHTSHGFPPGEIEELISRQRSNIYNYGRNKNRRTNIRKRQEYKKLTERVVRQIIRVAVIGKQLALHIRNTFKLDICVRCIQQILSSTPHISYIKRHKTVRSIIQK